MRLVLCKRATAEQSPKISFFSKKFKHFASESSHFGIPGRRFQPTAPPGAFTRNIQMYILHRGLRTPRNGPLGPDCLWFTLFFSRPNDFPIFGPGEFMNPPGLGAKPFWRQCGDEGGHPLFIHPKPAGFLLDCPLLTPSHNNVSSRVLRRKPFSINREGPLIIARVPDF